MEDDVVVVAAVQAAPVYLDREASLEKACRLITEAAATGAELVAFSETWLPGYPFFAFSGQSKLRWAASEAYLDQAVEIPGPETDALCDAARSAGVDLVIGVAELDSRTSGTVYCTMLSIGRDGQILGTHRKLKPTMDERIAWGEGTGDDLDVYDRPYGRISSLNCWEHQMVLPGYALMAQGTQFHIAGWPGGEPEVPPKAPIPLSSRQRLLSRAFAAQGACYVLAVGGLLTPEDVPDQFRSLAYTGTGDSMIIDPRGEVVASAPRGEEKILTHEARRSFIRSAKTANDVAGHYSRPDVFELLVNGENVLDLGRIPSPSSPDAGSTTSQGHT
ncbi:MAG: carbon-nitrogen hydrolase family protein [Actinomycetia bacterium]|nr:carbon-nitrogen hydrolase family protein [Actinomycetes bacterium]MCP4226138.1 carbon-nitrogen hydrolase family protein [Actinomycetes bacterium]MCP5035383.1 carbon-nitrogen hydrolase family protein [Actinomycetes bacterium]